MKILIIGSKGFIGSHCLDFFSKTHEVWQCDVVVDYSASNYKIIDATNANYDAVFESQDFNVCINCSGAASVPDSISNPQRDFNLNVSNVFKQLDAIRRHNANCKYINLSSAAVYGNPQYLPIDEAHPLAPISPYGCHKKMAEDICKEFFINFGVATCSLRIFSAYGPGLQKQLFWDLYKKSQFESNVQLYGTGNETRDFIFVSEVIKAIDLVIQKSEFENDTINVANGEELKIKEVVTEFYRSLNSNIDITFGGEERLGDPINWVADISKLKGMGYRQEVDLTNGLKSYVRWLFNSKDV